MNIPLRLRIRRPSGTTAIAWLALFVSLGGTSYAALVITGTQVKDSTLTTKDIKDRSLRAWLATLPSASSRVERPGRPDPRVRPALRAHRG